MSGGVQQLPPRAAARQGADVSALLSGILPVLASDAPGALRVRALVLASCRHGEGTTTVAAHLAAALSRYGGNPLLVEANFRTPSVEAPGSATGRGLVDYLFGSARVEDVIRRIDGSFHHIPAGRLGDDRVQLRELTRKVEELIRTATPVYDVVLFDSAPLLPYPEAALLARVVGRACMVVEAERTRWEVVLNAKRILDHHDVENLGVILNRKKRYVPRFMYQAL